MSATFKILEIFGKYVKNHDDLKKLIEGLQKIDRCITGVQQGIHIADILNDPKNYKNLQEIFRNYTSHGFQSIIQYALNDFSQKSLVLVKGIPRDRSSYLFKALGGWKQFQICLVTTGIADDGTMNMQIFNTSHRSDWDKMYDWPHGTLVSVYLKTIKGARSHDQEQEGLSRIIGLLDAVQFIQNDAISPKTKETPKKRQVKPRPSYQGYQNYGHPQTPIFSFDVKVNKLDTFVHAGNAALISRLARSYHGQLKMVVMRDKELTISVDPDSIWAASIQNGEVIRYDFYGQDIPADEFVKELARATNKYTQMDKVG